MNISTRQSTRAKRERRDALINECEQMLEAGCLTPENQQRFETKCSEIESLNAGLRLQQAAEGSGMPSGGGDDLFRGFEDRSPASRIIVGGGTRLQAFDNTRDGREAAYQAGKWAQATLLQDPAAGEWCRAHGMIPDVMSAHSGGVNTRGGALVPEAMSSSIIHLVEAHGLFRRLSRGYPMSTDTENIPRRTGGLEAHYVGENQEGTESDTAWDDVQLNAKKLMVLTRMSSEVSEDALISMADMLAMEAGLAFALKEDQVAFLGDGSSTYGGHVGLNTKILDGDHDNAYVAAASGHDTLGEIDADDLIALMALLPKYAKRGAVWICSPTAEEIVFNAIKLAGGGNSSDNLGRGNVPRFLGYPVEVTDVVADSLTDNYNGLPMIYFGNLAMASTLGTRREIRFQVSAERYFENDQIGVKATMRHSVNIHDLGSNTVKSPFAALLGTT